MFPLYSSSFFNWAGFSSLLPRKFVAIVMSMVFLNWAGFSSLFPQKFVAIAMSIAYLKEVVDQVINDDMDGDNNSDTNQEDGIHRLIQDTFAPMDEDNQDDSDDVDPLLEKSRQPLYEGSTKNLLSAILLLVNLKVLNGLSNICLT
jgi:hypothetical protein